MATSKKHYIAVAKAIRSNVEINQLEGETRIVDALKDVADNLATIFKQDNSAFQRDKFMDACGFK